MIKAEFIEEQAVEINEKNAPKDVQDKMRQMDALLKGVDLDQPGESQGESQEEKTDESPTQTDRENEPVEQESTTETVQQQDESPEKRDDDEPFFASEDYDKKVRIDGEEITLSALKDEAVKARAEQTQLIERENQLMQQYDALINFTNLLPDITPEQQTALANLQAIRQDQEYNMLVHAIPDWKDRTTFVNDKKAMLETLAQYGVNEAELDQVQDHRILKLAYDYDRLVRRLNTAKEQHKVTVKKTQPKPNKNKRAVKAKPDKNPVKPLRHDNVTDTVSKINALLAQQET